ncbi:ferritin-like fold-containing protein [Lacisediminihabitans profunda]|uniref:ferritin-like fold-containing protein n=1 Tax=Lacisediminihabitans profunda TaxID=2594790 RepID=UPI001FEBD614|nr:ferritin-like fold-containing protein [Lacisediminihabitans profunda]
MRVVKLFGRRPRRSDSARPGARRSPSDAVNRVDLEELTPDLLSYLGQAAYLQLVIFETLGRAVATAPSIASKEAMSRVAGLSLAKHHGLTAEIVRQGAEPGPTMQPYVAAIDNYVRITAGADWYETLVTSYITSGLLNDFARQLAGGLPADASARITALLGADDGHEIIVAELRSAIEANPRLASRLALWGRRLVGDTLLAARSALAANGHPDEARLEPVFTELIAAHTRRMDAIGLTA